MPHNSFLKAVLVPVCSINKNNLFHPPRQGSPGAQKPLWNGEYQSASQNKALKITLISFYLIPFHARLTIPKPRMSLTSHISPGHFCPETGVQPPAEGGWMPSCPDLRDIISSIVDSSKAGTPSGRIFPGRFSARGRGYSKAELQRGKVLAALEKCLHGAGEERRPGRQRMQEG